MTLRLTTLARLVFAAIALLVAIPLLIASDLPQRTFGDLLRADGINSVDGASRSLAYRLDEERETQFSFSGERRLIRFLSSVAVEAGAPLPSLGWVYGYRVSFLDTAGSVIAQRDIYKRGTLPVMTEDFQGRRFLRTSSEQIGIQDETIVDAPEGTSAVAITGLESEAGVVGIDIRVSERQPLTDSGALVAFLRRSPGEQRRLTEGSAFPADTLTEEEKVSLARNNWRPVGPSGIAGEAYQLTVIYETDVEDAVMEVEGAP